ncbi:MAG TPA: zf-HC2 domain-containing protein [Gemmatimonadales bacterium]|nr:zf-HC2 domain-containing protein [Gemmatimonadales bacterium]
MTGDLWTARLSEYLDDELAADERATLERHLADCAECRETLTELERVVGRARALDDRDPRRDLWPNIARQIGAPVPITAARRTGRRIALTVPQLAAAGLALLLAGGGGAAMFLRSHGAPPAPTGPMAVRSNGPVTATPARFAGVAYDQAVADLERVLRERRGSLDTATVRVLTESLASIDRAITRARAALAADPSDTYLNEHLAETMRRKLELLRRAAALATTSL